MSLFFCFSLYKRQEGGNKPKSFLKKKMNASRPFPSDIQKFIRASSFDLCPEP